MMSQDTVVELSYCNISLIKTDSTKSSLSFNFSKFNLQVTYTSNNQLFYLLKLVSFQNMNNNVIIELGVFCVTPAVQCGHLNRHSASFHPYLQIHLNTSRLYLRPQLLHHVAEKVIKLFALDVAVICSNETL